ncbi:hypothetical protein, partial [Xanthovirga aplysinae]|uniref:hypothetical protein n=1 Tax=Xanthovirga aplysinae TaxID=2529853 RepID=UPI001CA3FB6D
VRINTGSSNIPPTLDSLNSSPPTHPMDSIPVPVLDTLSLNSYRISRISFASLKIGLGHQFRLNSLKLGVQTGVSINK